MSQRPSREAQAGSTPADYDAAWSAMMSHSSDSPEFKVASEKLKEVYNQLPQEEKAKLWTNGAKAIADYSGAAMQMIQHIGR